MTLVSAKCPECGGNLKVDNTKKASNCEYCGAPFIVEEAIKNFNTNNVTIIQDELNRYWVMEENTLIKYNGTQKSIRIPQNVTNIASGAIVDKEEIDEVVIPSTVKKIAINAITAKKVVVENNPELEFTSKNGNHSLYNTDALVILGDVRELGQINSNNVGFIKYDGNENEFLIKVSNYTDVTVPVIFKDEKLVKYESKNTSKNVTGAGKVSYVLDENGKAIVLAWDKPTGSVEGGQDFIFDKVGKVDIVGFRGNGEKQFVNGIFTMYFSDDTISITLPEGIKNLSAPNDAFRGLVAKSISLPSTLEILGTGVLEAWDNIYFPNGYNLKEVKKGSIVTEKMDWNEKNFKFNKIEVPQMPTTEKNYEKFFEVVKPKEPEKPKEEPIIMMNVEVLLDKKLKGYVVKGKDKQGKEYNLPLINGINVIEVPNTSILYVYNKKDEKIHQHNLLNASVMTYRIKKKFVGSEMLQKEVNINKKKTKWEISSK